jgi:uncharacterized repeat protein (TIGR01451 family)
MMKRCNTALAVLLALGVTHNSLAGPKEDSMNRLTALSNQIDAVKVAGSSAELSSLLNEYQQLSASLGGDSAAAGQSAVQSGGQANLRSAPAAPPFTTANSANFSDAPGSAITTGAPVNALLAVSTADTYLWDVDLTINLTHTFASDLDITLTSPGGTTVTVTTDNGGGNDNVFAGTLFDDDATVPVTDEAYANNVTSTPLQIEASLAAFIGEDPNGNWTLNVTDDAGGDDGVLVDWALDVTTLDQTPIDTTTPFTDAPALPISDNSSNIDTQDVSGVDPFLCDLNLTTGITHTFASDLDITLTSPAGTVVTLTTDNGGGNDNVFDGTVWDDSATDPATDFIYANNVTAANLVAEGSLGAFIGEDPNGTWSLDVADDAGGDGGVLADWTLTVTTCAGIPDVDLAMTLTTTATPPVYVGTQGDISLNVSNNGPGDATGVVATATLPGGVSFISSGCASEAGGVITYNIGALANAGNTSCAATVQFDAIGMANITGGVSGNENDPLPANNTPTPLVIDVLSNDADLSMTLTTTAVPPVLLGDQIDISLNLFNSGPVDATGVVGTANLPAGVSFVSSGCASEAGGVVTYNAGGILNGGNTSCVATVQMNAVGMASFTGSVSGNEPDPVPANNTATPLVVDVQSTDADLQVSLSTLAIPPLAVGQQFVLTIDVLNNGPADATNVNAVMNLPNQLAFVSSGCASEAGGVVTFAVGGLLSGNNALCDVTVEVVQAGFLDITISVSGDQPDPNAGNNDTQLSIQGAVPAVPVNSFWTLLALLMMVLVVAHRRRQQF